MAFLRALRVAMLLVMVLTITVGGAAGQEAMDTHSGPNAPAAEQAPQQAPIERAEQPMQGPVVQPSASIFDKAIFQKPMPKDQLAFLTQFAGASSDELMRDKQFRKLMHSFVPDCMFHYGSDKPLPDALDEVIKGSKDPVVIREGRYLVVSGSMGPFLAGKGFLWIDMQEGFGVGGFYFHPTNGEPTPSVNIFSKQIVKENSLELGQLPPAFAEDFSAWAWGSRIPPVTTRYFITGSNKKILLEHDEDYCAPLPGTAATDMPPPSGCQEINAQAADLDMDAAEYLEQTHHVTNATAWMINDADQVAWLQVRARTCGVGLDCHIRMTRERTQVIVHHGAPPPRPGPHPIHR